MGQINPALMEKIELESKLWVHMYIISDYALDVDYPCELPTRAEVEKKPEKLPYPQEEIRYRYYGKSIPRFIQNILVSDNKTGALRYGTELTASFPFSDTLFAREVLAVMPFLKEDGTSEKLVYVSYLGQSAITHENITIVQHPSKVGWCRATL
ncbi:MAG: DUF4290 domain-containing protein, partial [Alphaproteobacteria bacterium]|nr:DUF4290 domain-containing protein [Alphaproteobacteria bacterium]